MPLYKLAIVVSVSTLEKDGTTKKIAHTKQKLPTKLQACMHTQAYSHPRNTCICTHLHSVPYIYVNGDQRTTSGVVPHVLSSLRFETHLELSNSPRLAVH